MKRIYYLCLLSIAFSCGSDVTEDHVELPDDFSDIFPINEPITPSSYSPMKASPHQTVPEYTGDYRVFSNQLARILPNADQLTGKRVFVQALISETGEVLQVEIIKPQLDPELQAEMIGHINKMTFKPGYSGDQAIKVRMLFPLFF